MADPYAEMMRGGQAPLVGTIMGDDPQSRAMAAQAGQWGRDAADWLRQYFADVMGGAYARQGLENMTGAYQWNPQISALENARTAARDPASIAQAMNIALALGAGPLKRVDNPIHAYHGSPHDFDNFSAEKIGTGEGAQAYGHGLYFSEIPQVAQQYRDKLSQRPDILVGGEPQPFAASAFGNYTADQITAARISSKYQALRTLGRSPSIDDIVKDVENEIENGIRMAAQRGDFSVFESLSNQKTALARMQDRGIGVKPNGRMYEVNIHADPQAFLDWDKPLAQQPEVLRRIRDVEQLSSVPIPDGSLSDAIGSEYYQRLIRQHAPETHNMPLGTAADRASNDLRWAGVPGIRYLDQGSRGAGEGTSNYVVFDPAIIEILRKYGLAGLLGGAGAVAASNPYADMMSVPQQ